MYEITFIVRDEKDTQIVKKVLEDNKTKVIYEEEVGRKNFTYPIKKEKSGFYYTFYLDLKPQDISSITNTLNTTTEIIRFLILKSNRDLESIKNKNTKKEKTFAKTSTDKKVEEVPVKEVEKEIKENSKKIVKTKKTKKVTKKKTVVAKEKVSKKEEKTDKNKELEESDEQERIKKLDEKLDELLKD